MKTSSMISTICYNTDDFLIKKLDELVMFKKIDFYAFISHQPEESEKKAHKHLFIIPNSTIDTRSLDDYLIESTGINTLPLGTCTIWKKVEKDKESHWILYALHDVEYLKSKGLTRFYHYDSEEFKTSNKDALSHLIYDAFHTSEFCYNKTIIEHFKNAEDINSASRDLVLNGYVPISNMCGLHHLAQILKGV